MRMSECVGVRPRACVTYKNNKKVLEDFPATEQLEFSIHRLLTSNLLQDLCFNES